MCCAATRRRSSTTSNVRNDPTPRLWSVMNFAHPPPTLTAEKPVLTSGRCRNCSGHSSFNDIEVTRAQSSSTGQPVSAVKVAGIFCCVPPFPTKVRIHPTKSPNTQGSTMGIPGGDEHKVCATRELPVFPNLPGAAARTERQVRARSTELPRRPARASPPPPTNCPP